MASRDDIVIEITPQVLLKAYACGIFPMAESCRRPGALLDRAAAAGHPAARCVHVPKRLARTVRQGRFEMRIDHRLRGGDRGLRHVASGPAARPGSTAASAGSTAICSTLGYCHTVEAWAGNRLVGGLYGVALNGAFFGESMFSNARDASKVALVYLVRAADRRRL